MQVGKETAAHHSGGRNENLSSDESGNLDEGSPPDADSINSFSGTAGVDGDLSAHSSGDHSAHSSGDGKAKVFGGALRPDVVSTVAEAVRGAGSVTDSAPRWWWLLWAVIAVVVLAVCQTGRRRRMQKRRGAPSGGIIGPGVSDARRRGINRP